MSNVPTTPTSSSRTRKNRTPVPVKPLESLMKADTSPLGERSPLPPLPTVSFCTNHNHGLSLPVLHGTIAHTGSGVTTRPTLLERRNRKGMSMSCLSGLSMDTIHESSRDQGAVQVSADDVPPATFRGWSTDTADAAMLSVAHAAAGPSIPDAPSQRRAAPSPLTTSNSASATSKGGKDDKHVPPSVCLVSYNILASRLVTTDRYPDCPPAALGEDYRLKLIREELRLANADLIALQEISVGVFEDDDNLGGYLRNDGEYDGEFVVITNKDGTDRCEMQPRSHDEEKGTPSKSVAGGVDTGVRLSSMLLPTLPLSRRDSRAGSSATGTLSDEVGLGITSPLYRERSPILPEPSTNSSLTLVAHPPAATARGGQAGRSPRSRKKHPAGTRPTAAYTVRSPSAQATDSVTEVTADGSAGALAGSPSSALLPRVQPPHDKQQSTRRTEMDGVALFWKRSRFELLEASRVRFNQLAARDESLTAWERKKLQVDSHNVALICVLREVANPTNVFIVATVHLIWQRVEAQLWQANELLKAVESLKRKYRRGATVPKTLSPYNVSLGRSPCSQSMPVTLSAPAPQPLTNRAPASTHLRQSESNFSPRRGTNSASFTRLGPGAVDLSSPPVAPRITCLIAGDFNADPTNPVVAFFTARAPAERADIVRHWRRPALDSLTTTGRGDTDEDDPTAAGTDPKRPARSPADGGSGDREKADVSWPPAHSAESSTTLNPPPPPCKNWSRKRTVNPTTVLESEAVPDAAVDSATATPAVLASGPVTPPRDGRGEAYRGRRLDGETTTTTATPGVDEESPSHGGGLPSFDDLPHSQAKGVDASAVDSGVSPDHLDADRLCGSKAYSELSAGADPKQTLFVPTLLADHSGGDSCATGSRKASPGVAPTVVASCAAGPLATTRATQSDAESSATRWLSSIGSSPQPVDGDGWLCECGSPDVGKDDLHGCLLASPLNLPQSRLSNRKPLPSMGSSGVSDTKSDGTPTLTATLRDAYAVYRARHPKLVSAVNPSTNAEGKVLDHIFYESDHLACQSVLKLGELVELPNTFFPSDHYMVGAVFAPYPSA